MDLTGSGNETLSHLHEPGNGRITIMLNAYEGPPKIVRLWGKGRVLENGTAPFDAFVQQHDVKLIPGSRSIIIVDIHQVGSSCGFSVPYYDFKEYRPILNDFMAKKAEKFKAGNEKESMDRYWVSASTRLPSAATDADVLVQGLQKRLVYGWATRDETRDVGSQRVQCRAHQKDGRPFGPHAIHGRRGLESVASATHRVVELPHWHCSHIMWPIATADGA